MIKQKSLCIVCARSKPLEKFDIAKYTTMLHRYILYIIAYIFIKKITIIISPSTPLEYFYKSTFRCKNWHKTRWKRSSLFLGIIGIYIILSSTVYTTYLLTLRFCHVIFKFRLPVFLCPVIIHDSLKVSKNGLNMFHFLGP